MAMASQFEKKILEDNMDDIKQMQQGSKKKKRNVAKVKSIHGAGQVGNKFVNKMKNSLDKSQTAAGDTSAKAFNHQHIAKRN
jgi:hypothetical protein